MRPTRGPHRMPSARRQKKTARPAARSSAAHGRPKPKKPSRPSAKPAHKPAPKPLAPSKSKPTPKGKASSPAAPAPPLELPLPGGRHHVLSLSFVRDGDEFLARLEPDAGHITALKNRSLDQLLTLVASELEDLLE